MTLRENNYNLSARRFKGKKKRKNVLSQSQVTLVSDSNIIKWGRVFKVYLTATTIERFRSRIKEAYHTKNRLKRTAEGIIGRCCLRQLSVRLDRRC